MVWQKIQNVVPVMVPSVPKEIINKYKKFTLLCELMHINGIGFLNTTPQQIIFDIRSMIKNIKINNIEDEIKQVHNLHL